MSNNKSLEDLAHEYEENIPILESQIKEIDQQIKITFGNGRLSLKQKKATLEAMLADVQYNAAVLKHYYDK